jgi:hypothetical protein
MKQTIKQVCVGVLTLVVFLLSAGCSAAPLPDGFDADEVTARAEEIVGYASDGKFDLINETVREDLKTILSSKILEDAITPVNERIGALESIKKVVLSGTADSTTGEDYAVVQVLCTHEDGDVLYMLSFDKDLQLVGLYLK